MEKIYLCCAPSGTSEKEQKKIYAITVSMQEWEELETPFCVTGEMALWDNVLYCLAEKHSVRGIYTWTLEQKYAEQLIRENDEKFINGFSMNY